MKTHYQVLIIGGGTGGIMSSSMLLVLNKLSYPFWNKMMKGEEV
jgi:thioredoxin reductase